MAAVIEEKRNYKQNIYTKKAIKKNRKATKKKIIIIIILFSKKFLHGEQEKSN